MYRQFRQTASEAKFAEFYQRLSDVCSRVSQMYGVNRVSLVQRQDSKLHRDIAEFELQHPVEESSVRAIVVLNHSPLSRMSCKVTTFVNGKSCTQKEFWTKVREIDKDWATYHKEQCQYTDPIKIPNWLL